jgi:hypothetical protein
MDPFSLISTVTGLGTLSGLNLYLTVLLTGLAVRFNFLNLGQTHEPLMILANPWVIGISAGLYLVEFFADKIPWIDSIWDAVHTFIRPLGACLLALETLGDASPLLKTVGVLIAGGSSLTTHTAKAATRAVANVSPEPVSNIALSLVEDATVAGGTAMMFLFPTIMLVLCVLVIAALWLVLPRLFRRIGGFFRILKLKIFGVPSHAQQ